MIKRVFFSCVQKIEKKRGLRKVLLETRFFSELIKFAAIKNITWNIHRIQKSAHIPSDGVSNKVYLQYNNEKTQRTRLRGHFRISVPLKVACHGL